MNLNVLFKAENIFLSCNIGYLMYKMIKRKQIIHDEALSTFEIASKVPVRLVPVDILKTLELALEFNIYAYEPLAKPKTLNAVISNNSPFHFF